MARFGASALAVLIISASCLAASAADIAPPAPFDPGQGAAAEPQLEFGTNWYLRADIGWTRSQGAVVFSDPNVFNDTRIKNAGLFSAGFGYKLNDWFRTDLTGEWHKSFSTSTVGPTVYCPYGPVQGLSNAAGAQLGYAYNPAETCRSQNGTEQKRAALFVNADVDLGNWHGVTPYLGAGAGMALIRSSGTLSYFQTSNGAAYAPDLSPTGTFPLIWVDRFTGNAISPQPNIAFAKTNWDQRTSRSNYNFAWALMGGVAIDVANRTKLDIGYRYSNFGQVAALAAPNGQIIKRTISSQELRLGLRYAID